MPSPDEPMARSFVLVVQVPPAGARRIGDTSPPGRRTLSRRPRACLLALAALSVLALAGCGSSNDPEPNTSKPVTSKDAAATRCQPLPATARTHLSSALYSGTLVGPVYVRSNDFEHVFMVAALVNGRPAVWAMNQLDGSGLIISLNEQAYQVSGMGRGETLRDPITVADDGAAEALGCVG